MQKKEILIKKLTEENDELQRKITGLEFFIGEPDFDELSWECQRLLETQLSAMKAYETSLRMRISLIMNDKNLKQKTE